VNDDPKIWHFAENDFKEVRPGMLRRVFNGDGLSLCFWRIDSSTPPTAYDGHPENEQFGLIIAGQLDFRLGSEKRELLGPGDVYYAPQNCPHGDSRFLGDPATGETWILDIFRPVREEYRHG
jgi:hypothetical protein